MNRYLSPDHDQLLIEFIVRHVAVHLITSGVIGRHSENRRGFSPVRDIQQYAAYLHALFVVLIWKLWVSQSATLGARNVRVGPKFGQIGPIWDKSGAFFFRSVSVYFDSPSQNVLKFDRTQFGPTILTSLFVE